MPSTIGWTTVIAANAYFSTERLESTAWDALTAISGGKDEKTAVLTTAYNRIRFCRDFEIPNSPSTSQLERLALAQHELSYYLSLHMADEDRRKGLHAQGVVGANVVGETYVRFQSDTMDLKTVPLPPIVYEILDSFAKYSTPFFAVDIDRDEDYSVDEDVTDLL